MNRRNKQAIEQNIDERGQEVAMAALGAAMADVSRMTLLCALMDGRAWTATELSVAAEIAPSTTSAHLSRLLKGKLITCVSQGRHRYYRLFDTEVASLIETMMGMSWKNIDPPKSRTPTELRKARTCYDHLAGEIAVDIYNFMLENAWITPQGESLTSLGKTKFEELGVNLNSFSKRKKCCACLDWSERKFHLGGEAGAQLFKYFENHGWISKVDGYREVTISKKGQQSFERVFYIHV